MLALILLVAVGCWLAGAILVLAAANHERPISHDTLYTGVVLQFGALSLAATALSVLSILGEGEVSPHQAKRILLFALSRSIHHQLLYRLEMHFVVEVCVRHVAYACVLIETKLDVESPAAMLLLIRVV